jgi:hypothetical protein
MNYRPLFIAVVVTFSTVVGINLATQVRTTSSTAQMPPEITATQPKAIAATSSPHASEPKNPSISRQRLQIRDVVRWGSEFYLFRERLRQAVRDRDVFFVKNLIPEQGISLGFGRNRSAEQLQLENPNADFWVILEKAIAQGCDMPEAISSTQSSTSLLPSALESSTAPKTEQTWECPNVMQTFYQQYPQLVADLGVKDDLSHIIVVGAGVNVRSQPNRQSSVLTTLSNEVVQLDASAWAEMRAKRTDPQPQPQGLEDWIPVILPDAKQGYVASRYAYSPLDYRVIFGKVNGEWQMLSVPGGD